MTQSVVLRSVMTVNDEWTNARRCIASSSTSSSIARTQRVDINHAMQRDVATRKTNKQTNERFPFYYIILVSPLVLIDRRAHAAIPIASSSSLDSSSSRYVTSTATDGRCCRTRTPASRNSLFAAA